jgi:hypothetical protein
LKLAFISAPSNGGRLHQSWRGQLLARAIQKTRHATATTFDTQSLFTPGGLAQIECAAADIIILQASSHPAVLAAIQHYKTMDKSVILDLGPDCLTIDEKTSGGKSVGANSLVDLVGPSLSEVVQWGLRLVDAVTTPSQRMLDDIHGLSPAILIPEYIDLDRYLTLGPQPHDGIILGWKNNSGDAAGVLASGLQAALERICQVRQEVRIAIFGGDPAIASRFNLPEGRLQYYPVDHVDDWPSLLSYVDIGLAPLSGAVDERRGSADVLEFMSMKIPWVASHGPAYYELRPYGWIIENNASTWERVLLDVIDHLPAYHEEACGDPYLFAISQGIDENIETVLNVFTDLQGMSQVERQYNENG